MRKQTQKETQDITASEVRRVTENRYTVRLAYKVNRVEDFHINADTRKKAVNTAVARAHEERDGVDVIVLGVETDE